MNPLQELDTLVQNFPEKATLFQHVEHIPSATTPEPYRSMLVHEHHMTVTMENYHQCAVDVKVLDSHLDGESYTRKILLSKQGTSQVVQFGIVRFNFETVTAAVKEEILNGKTPLGRVLIQHNVLRHIDLGAILRISTGERLAQHFACEQGTLTYGRLATIFCNNKPAVDLLEISAPLWKKE